MTSGQLTLIIALFTICILLLLDLFSDRKLRKILDNVISNQQKLFTMNKKLSEQMDLLTDKVAAEGSVVNGVITLLNGISAQLKDALTGENVSDGAQATLVLLEQITWIKSCIIFNCCLF